MTVKESVLFTTCSIFHQENEVVMDAFESDDDSTNKWERMSFHNDAMSSGVVNLYEEYNSNVFINLLRRVAIP